MARPCHHTPALPPQEDAAGVAWGVAEGGTGEAYAAVAETHSAVVFLAGERAYKMKKPVDLGFLDFTEPGARAAACRREVELNRRFAPDVYLGVAAIHGPDGRVCDHLVVMRRMPAARRLSTLVRAGIPVEGPLRQVARVLAAWHAAAPRSAQISVQGSPDAVRARWEASIRQLRGLAGRLPELVAADEVERLAGRFIAGREALFQERICGGYIVDGHGDLLADDIFCLDDGVRILDCLEFDDRLRWVDGLDDAAFLAMTWNGSALRAWRRSSPDGMPGIRLTRPSTRCATTTRRTGRWSAPRSPCCGRRRGTPSEGQRHGSWPQ
jgi:aminoglycoside phosphotransferase family enzyme